MRFIKRWLHDVLQWGFPKKISGGDSFQPTYTCEFCDYKLAQDSTGAYFHLSQLSK